LDPSLTSGSVIATIGITTVFFALVTLIAMISLMARFLSPEEANAAAPATTPPAPEPTGESAKEASNKADASPASETDFQQIALTAYAYHRRATTRVANADPASAWEAAGRIRELTQRIDRN